MYIFSTWVFCCFSTTYWKHTLLLCIVFSSLEWSIDYVLIYFIKIHLWITHVEIKRVSHITTRSDNVSPKSHSLASKIPVPRRNLPWSSCQYKLLSLSLMALRTWRWYSDWDPLIRVFSLLSIPHCLDNCSFVLCLKAL